MKDFFLALALTIMMAATAYAHPPSKVAVTCDPAAKKVTAAIMHSVSNPSRHYIFKAELVVNGKIVKDEKFDRQQDDSQQTAVFEAVALKTGDEVTVVGYCNISGKRAGSVKVE
jgi:desulfoferrodoxin (superoxide reductase-like protein)